MTRVKLRGGWKLLLQFLQTLHQLAVAATLKVGTSHAHVKQRVARESHSFLLTVEDGRARRVPRGSDDLQLVFAW